MLKEIHISLQKLLCLKLAVKGGDALLGPADHTTVTIYARDAALIGEHQQERQTDLSSA